MLLKKNANSTWECFYDVLNFRSNLRLLSLLTYISILVEADHQTPFSCSIDLAGFSLGEWRVNYEASIARYSEKKAENPKTLLAKNSVKFIDFVEPQRPHGRPLLRLLGRSYT